MERQGTNVIDFSTRREASAPRPLREVEAYWELLRDGRLVPDRSEVDPRGFPGALAHSFLLERIAPGHARVRVTGRHLSDLMGIDMQGLPLSSLFLRRPVIYRNMARFTGRMTESDGRTTDMDLSGQAEFVITR